MTGTSAMRVVLAASVVALLGCGGRFHSAPPTAATRLDERTGAYGRLRLGMWDDRVRVQLGRGQHGDASRASSPLGVGAADLSGPNTMPSDASYLRYRNLVVLIRGGHLVGYATTAPSMRTTHGARLGMSLDELEERYAGLGCGTVTYGEGGGDHPYCAASLGRHVGIWFGGDPIDSVWVERGMRTGAPRGTLLRPRRR